MSLSWTVNCDAKEMLMYILEHTNLSLNQVSQILDVHEQKLEHLLSKKYMCSIPLSDELTVLFYIVRALDNESKV